MDGARVDKGLSDTVRATGSEGCVDPGRDKDHAEVDRAIFSGECIEGTCDAESDGCIEGKRGSDSDGCIDSERAADPEGKRDGDLVNSDGSRDPAMEP